MNWELEKRGPHERGRAQGDDKWQVHFLPVLVSWVAAWAVCALWALWGSGPRSVVPSNSFAHSANTYAARILCQGLGIKQNKVPCPCGADILTEKTPVNNKHTKK